MKALIIIDMFVKDVRGRYDEKKLINNQLKLINEFKKKNYPVIYTKAKIHTPRNIPYENLWGDEYADGAKNKKEAKKIKEQNLALIPELLDITCDKIIEKEIYSAFYNTDLEKYCKKKKITELYFAGISSGCCVFFSAVDALYRKIQPILVTDASGSTSASWHKKNIENFRVLVGMTKTTKQVINKI